jgi:hypothetical protein
MFLYYLVDLRFEQPKILYLYCGQQSLHNKVDLIKSLWDHIPNETEKIIYSRVPVSEICGLFNLCDDSDEKQIYFFYQGGYDFLFAVAKNHEEAQQCLLNNSETLTGHSFSHYDSHSLDQIRGLCYRGETL